MSVTFFFCLVNYEFSPHTVYPGQDLHRKRRPKARLCRDMSLSPATPPPPLSILKWQTWNLPDKRDIEKYELYFRLDSHNLNSANYKHKAKIARSEYAYIVSPVLKSNKKLHTTAHYKVRYFGWVCKRQWKCILLSNLDVFYILYATNKSISAWI